ncbi:hypothetical protein ES702_04220 [subsurface metagenome]
MAMAEKNQTEALEKANKNYQEFLDLANQKTQEAKEQGKDIEELAILITEKTLKHQEILAEVFEKVPEEAKKGIEKAIEISKKDYEVVIKTVSEIKKEKEKMEKECFEEGETYFPGDDKECCAGLKGMTVTYGNGIICTMPMGYVCTAFCGDGKCEGEYENACSCPEDCPKSESEEIFCTTNNDCGTDTCHQGRDKCVEIKYICEDGKCSSTSKEYANYSCARYYSPELTYPELGKCLDTCGDGICKSPETKFWCPEDCLKEPLVGGPCSYDTFKGKCKITSIINENTIKFKFTPTEPLSEKAKRVDLTREREKYVGYLGLECLKNKYPITKEDLEKCHIKENTVFDCELEVITSGTCTPIIFKFLIILIGFL